MEAIKIQKIAKRFFKQHNLKWHLELRNIKDIGACDYKNRVITLDDYYVEHNSESVVVDTLLHEMAHIFAPGHKHDKVWKALAKKLGCKPESCKSAVIRPGKYQAICLCGVTFQKYRKPNTKGYYCPVCKRQLNFLEVKNEG